MRRWSGILLMSVVFCSSVALANEPQKKSVLSRFDVNFYGYVKADMIFEDSQGVNGNITLWAPSEPAGNDAQFGFTMNQTRLGFSVTAPPALGGTPRGVIEMDFYGGGADNRPNPRLYRVFIEWKWQNFLLMVGQDWDTHSWLYGKTLVFNFPPVGNPQFRRPQLRAVKTVPLVEDANLILAGALARTISGDLDGFGRNDGDDAGWPTLEGRIAYEQKVANNLPLTIGFSGHYGQEEIDWDAAGTDVDVKTWSINGELIVPFWSIAYLKGEFFYGANLDDFFGGITQGVNQTTREEIEAIGGWAELAFMIGKKTEFRVGGGLDKPRESHLSNGNRRQNMALFSNVHYQFAKHLIWGVEYIYYKTLYLNSPSGDNNRVQTSLILPF